MKLTVLAALAALLFTAGLTAQSTDGTMMKSDSSTADGTMMKSDDTMMKSDNTMMNSDNTMMKSDSTMMKSDASMMVSDADRKMSADPMDISAFNLKGLGNQVVAFKSEAAAQALAKKGTVVYFFAATWCPECQATYKDLKANFSMLPKNFTLVFVNYDKAKELKMKYGITAQHTFVQLGAMGEKKKVWSTSMTVGDLVQSTMM